MTRPRYARIASLKTLEAFAAHLASCGADLPFDPTVQTGPDAPLAQAAAIMVEGRFSSLPVVDGNRLVGIVTERDALKALARTLPAVKGMDPDTFLW